MRPFVLALRSIGTELAMRLYVPVVITAAIIMALLVALALWLTTIDGGWWLLFIPLVILFFAVSVIAIAALFLIRLVRPPQTKEQKQAVKRFVDRVQNILEIIGTPKGFIFVRVLWSVAVPSKNSFLSDLVSNRELANDFRDIQRSFDSRL